jgi:hypothetical protein
VSSTDCNAADRKAELSAKLYAQTLQAELDKTGGSVWNVSVQAESRALNYSYRFKKPVLTNEAFHHANDTMQKQLLGAYCSQKYWNGKDLGVKETHTLYSSEGKRLASFSIEPVDCPD